jgi:hypothetical protein
MQLPTHLLTGIVIQYILFQLFPEQNILVLLLVFFIAFTSHFFLDALAKVTYHPPVKEPGYFWAIWHIFVYSLGILIIILYIQSFFLGMLAANLVDLWDWVFLRNYANRRNQPEWGKKYYLHPIADKIRQSLFFWVPNLNHSKIGILPEILVYTSWFFISILTLR